MIDINYVELGNVCEVVRGGSPRPIMDYITDDADGVNWLKIGDVSETDKFFTHAKERIKPSGIPKTREVKKGDLILSNSMSFGRAFITLIDGYIHDGWLRLRCDESIIDKEYLYYFLTSSIAQHQFKAVATGSVVNNLKADTVKAAKVALPSLDVQKKIASVLSVLDDKIVTNEAINRNLFDQAISLFEQLYQEYEDRKIGDLDVLVTDYVSNGSFKSLKDNVSILEEKSHAYFIRNVDLKSKNYTRFVDQHSYDFLKKSKLVGGEVIISNVGDVGSVFLCPELDGPMTLGNNMIMLNSEKHNNYLFLYFKSYIGQGMLAGITGGSAQPKFNKTDFRSLRIKFPDENQIDKFNEITNELLVMMSSLDKENKWLEILRNSLLPRLMSGKLDISELYI